MSRVDHIQLDSESIPKHISIVMDGNGRWAKKRLQPRLFGHRAAMKVVHETVELCSDLGVKVLTLYAFSTENRKRSTEEVMGLMDIAVEYFFKEIDDLNKHNVRTFVIGDVAGLPKKVQEAAANTEQKTAGNTGMILNLALNYGGRADILQAAKKLLKEGVDPDTLTEDTFAAQLYTGGLPDPDIMIRTGGEKRLSNFMLWQHSYTEFFFEDILFPDVTKDFIIGILERYQNRDRRYGDVK